jgi:hypothetical protein
MYGDKALARRVVQRSVEIGWKHLRYEEMILVPYLDIGKSLADTLAFDIPDHRRDEGAFYAAIVLRKEFIESNANWVRRLGRSEEVDRLLDIVHREIVETIERRPEARRLPIPPALDLQVQESGFIAWRPFSNREPVPQSQGVYLLARFDASPPQIVDPCDEAVIDIGMADKQTIRQRLNGFQSVALTGRGGKSSGWPYRNSFVRSYEELINFAGLYVSWRTFPWPGNESIAVYEDRLLKEYRSTWMRRPAINNQALRRNQE